MTQLAKIAKKVHCHQSTLQRFVRAGTLPGTKVRNPKTGRMTWTTAATVEEVAALLKAKAPRAGFRRMPRVNGVAHAAPKATGFLQTALQWRDIPATKRSALLKLANACTPKELDVLLDLATS